MGSMKTAGFKDVNPANVIIMTALAYFVLQVGFFVFHTPALVPPDEKFHFLQSLLFYSNPGLTPPSPESLDAWIGTNSRAFYLYHLLTGKAMNLNALLGWPDLYFLRFLNGLMAIATVIVFVPLARLTLKDDVRVALAVVILVSVLMFAFLGGAVSYDNLTNLLSMVSIYFFARFIYEREKRDFYALVICLGLGAITKEAFLPLAAALFLIAVVAGLKTYPVAQLFSPRAERGTRSIPMFLFALAVLIVTISIVQHTGNFARYGRLTPSCAQIYDQEQCKREHPVYRKYSSLSSEIDRSNKLQMDPVRYFVVWGDYMLEKALGIFAYASWYPAAWFMTTVELLFLCALIAVWRNEGTVLLDGFKLFVVVAVLYTLVLAFYVNYAGFRGSGLLPRYSFIGVQGRYMFPVMSLVVVVFVRYLLSFRSRRINTVIACAVGALFLANGFPAYILSESGLTRNNLLQDAYIERLIHSQKYSYR